MTSAALEQKFQAYKYKQAAKGRQLSELPAGSGELREREGSQFIPPYELNALRKLDEIRKQTITTQKEIREETVILAKKSTTLIESTLQTAVHRAVRSVNKIKILRSTMITEGKPVQHFADSPEMVFEVVSKTISDFKNLIQMVGEASSAHFAKEQVHNRRAELLELRNSFMADEMQLWIESHRKISITLDKSQEVYTETLSYLAYIMKERYQWKASQTRPNRKTDDSDTFIKRCQHFMSQTPPPHYRFGDETGAVADKFVRLLKGKGAADNANHSIGKPSSEIDILMKLIRSIEAGTSSSLNTQTTTNGDQDNSELDEQRRLFTIRQADAKWHRHIEDLFTPIITTAKANITHIRNEVTAFQSVVTDTIVKVVEQVTKICSLSSRGQKGGQKQQKSPIAIPLLKTASHPSPEPLSLSTAVVKQLDHPPPLPPRRMSSMRVPRPPSSSDENSLRKRSMSARCMSELREKRDESFQKVNLSVPDQLQEIELHQQYSKSNLKPEEVTPLLLAMEYSDKSRIACAAAGIALLSVCCLNASSSPSLSQLSCFTRDVALLESGEVFTSLRANQILFSQNAIYQIDKLESLKTYQETLLQTFEESAQQSHGDTTCESPKSNLSDVYDTTVS